MAVSIEIGDWLHAFAHALQPVFAIGDVHGRDDLFAVQFHGSRLRFIQAIAADTASHWPQR